MELLVSPTCQPNGPAAARSLACLGRNLPLALSSGGASVGAGEQVRSRTLAAEACHSRPTRSVGPPISGLPAHDTQCRKKGFEFRDLFLVGDFHRFANHAHQELYLIAIKFHKVAFHDVTASHKFTDGMR